MRPLGLPEPPFLKGWNFSPILLAVCVLALCPVPPLHANVPTSILALARGYGYDGVSPSPHGYGMAQSLVAVDGLGHSSVDRLGIAAQAAGFIACSPRFTGKERDGESGLDYFGARYFSGVQGRFTSPDAPFADQFAEDPQSWNLYSYTRNNPLKYVDRTGEAIETVWDVLNIGWGVKSFVDNARSGNYGSATVDAVGVIVDSAAAAVPFIPGGAGAGIRALRVADSVADAAALAT